MFSSRLDVLLPAHRPPHRHLACPEPRRERSEGPAFSHPIPSTAPSSHASDRLHPFSPATRLRKRRNTSNFNPLMRLLYNSRMRRVGAGLDASSWSAHSLAQPTSNLERPLIASIPIKIRTYAKQVRNSFGICTSKTQHLKPFRIRSYRKTGEGVPFDSSILDILDYATPRSMLRPSR